MDSSLIKTNLQAINFEKHSAIVQCHIDKNRMWILNSEGNFDYYYPIGHEPPVRISIDRGINPKKIWSNNRSTRFIIETADFSLYYFQTSDLISDLFCPNKITTTTQTIGMNDFFRIGVLKNGPVSTIFFDDDPRDPYCTKQIFIIIKGGGVLILSIETLLDGETKQKNTIISDFHTFPSLFANYNILDMKIFRFIERKPTLEVLKKIKEEAEVVQNKFESVKEICEKVENKKYLTNSKIDELHEIFINTNSKIEAIFKLYKEFDSFYQILSYSIEQETDNEQLNKKDQSSSNKKNSIEEINNNDNEGNLRFELGSNIFDDIERFLKDKYQKNDIDSKYLLNFIENQNEIHPSYQIWLDCIAGSKSVKTELEDAISNIYRAAYFYQQIEHLYKTGIIQNNVIMNEEEDKQEKKKKKSISDAENHEEEEEFQTLFPFEFTFNFDDAFDIDKKGKETDSNDKKGKEKKKGKGNKKNSPEIPNYINIIKVDIETQIQKIKNFIKNKKVKSFKKIIELKDAILEREKNIKEINNKIKSIEEKLKQLFEKAKLKPVEYDKKYESSREDKFQMNEDIESLNQSFINNIDENNKDILNNLHENAEGGIALLKSIDSFCSYIKLFFEDFNSVDVDKNPFYIIRNHVIILAIDRVILGISDDDRQLNKIFEAFRDNKRETIYEQIFINLPSIPGNIDIHSRLIHKPLKLIPSYKRPTFYIICWDENNNCNTCYSFKFKRNDQVKKKTFSKINTKFKDFYELICNTYINRDERFIVKKILVYEFEPNMKLIYYQITPSGFLVVQNGSRADSKAVTYEISSFLQDETNTSKRNKILWYNEITDYSLLPLIGCDFSLESGLILYNSMNIRLIKRENVDSESFEKLIEIKNPRLIFKVRKDLAITTQQKKETFFILLIYTMDQLYIFESALHKRNKNIDIIFNKVKEAKNALMKLINNAPCSKMSIFLFLMNDKELKKKINYYISNDYDNDEKLFERFRRFRIEFLIYLLESTKIKNQQKILMVIAYDLLIQFFSTRNNKPIFVDDPTAKSETNDNGTDFPHLICINYQSDEDSIYKNNGKDIQNEIDLYFQKSYTETIDIKVITDLTKKYGSNLASPIIAYYIVKCFPILDPALLYASENESYVENAYSKINKFIVESSREAELLPVSQANFTEALKLLQNLIDKEQQFKNDKKMKQNKSDTRIFKTENDTKPIKNKTDTRINKNEIDKLTNCLLIFGIEKFNDQQWFINKFEKFFKNNVLKITQTILSLFIFDRQLYKESNKDNNKENNKENKDVKIVPQFDPVLRFMSRYYESKNKNEHKKIPIDLLFSIYVSMEKSEKIELLRKGNYKYDMTLAIYRLSRIRVRAAKFLDQLKMTSVAIDVVLDDESPTTAIKFTSSLKDENTMLYLVRTASRKKKEGEQKNSFDSVYENVVDGKRNTSSTQLYDVLLSIPDDKLIKVKDNIFKTFEEIDEKSNEEFKKIHSLNEKIKSKGNSINSYYMMNTPVSICDICHKIVIDDDFYVFPCGHFFHKNCYKKRKDNDDSDRELTLSLHRNVHMFTTNENQLCPLCGLGAIELIGSPFYSLVDENKNKDVKALNKKLNDDYGNDWYINEDDNDFND